MREPGPGPRSCLALSLQHLTCSKLSMSARNPENSGTSKTAMLEDPECSHLPMQREKEWKQTQHQDNKWYMNNWNRLQRKILKGSALLWSTSWKPWSTWFYKILFSAFIQQQFSTTLSSQRCRRPGKWQQKSTREDVVSCGAACLIFQLLTEKMHLVEKEITPWSRKHFCSFLSKGL